MAEDRGGERGVWQPERVAAYFARSDGEYRFARWGRGLAPAFFGLDAEQERLWGEAVRAAGALCGLKAGGEDPELGVNFMVFNCDAWAELRAVPGLDRLIPDIERLSRTLEATGANQWRIYGFEPAGGRRRGAIRIVITLIRRDEDLARFSERSLALGQVVQGLLLWSDHAFTAESPVAEIEAVGRAVIKPHLAALIRAAYDAGLPDASADAAHAGDIAAIMGREGAGDG